MSRRASLYCLDEPIAGVDPAARDYILSTILNNYDENATILISTHLISDVENILDDVVFIQNGQDVYKRQVLSFRSQKLIWDWKLKKEKFTLMNCKTLQNVVCAELLP